MAVGIVFATISAFFFGLYVVPKKMVHIHPLVYTMFTGLGFFMTSLFAFALAILTDKAQLGDLLDANMVLAAIEGILWYLGLFLLLSAVDRIGVIRANQWKNLQGPIGVLLSLVILAEYQSVNPFYVLVAGFTVFASALFFNIQSSDSKEAVNGNGLLLALASAVLFGLVTVVNKYVTDNSGVPAQQLVWSFTVFVLALVMVASSKRMRTELVVIAPKSAMLGLLGGVLYFGASYSMLKAYENIEASIAFTIIQLNFLVVVILGIILFGEIDLRRYYKRVLFGIVFALMGIVLLVVAKN